MIKNLAILLTLFVFISCKKENIKPNENIKTEKVIVKKDKSIENPEKVGDQVFEILKNIDKKSNEQYQEQVITYQEIKDLSNNPDAKLDESIRNDFQSITPQQFAEISIKDFDEIKFAGKKYNIDWSTITFSEFKHEVFEFNGVKGLKGETYFKNKDGKIYFVKSQSFYNGKGYEIIKVAEIEEKR